MSPAYREYGFKNAARSHMHRHFMPSILRFCGPLQPRLRVLDIGCGNGAACATFIASACDVTGIDLSEEGVALARQEYPTARFEVLSADDHLLERLGGAPFDMIISTEVVEHLYAPREWARGAFHALKPGGVFVCTTPYHGYLKNLALSLLGSWDKHANPLWDGGHIKLWSRKTLTALLEEAGFRNIRVAGAGRMAGLWMTMVARAEKPSLQEAQR